MLIVYADESGTNDPTGQERGSAIPTVCGFVETADYWAQFRRKWKRMLDAYRALYFHFREFANKILLSRRTSPYYGWSDKKRDSFLYDLAFVASEQAVPAGGFYNAKIHHNLGLEGNPFENAVNLFFSDLRVALDDHWRGFPGKISLIFDRCESEQMLVPLNNAYRAFAKADRRISEPLALADDKDPQHLPLQAADLYAYAARQYAERQMAHPGTEEPKRLLDFILNKNLYVARKMISRPAWAITVKLVRQHQLKQTAEWAKQGMPRKVYYPEQHFPFQDYMK
jgi:hypothetical protein